ncbi:MAG: purine-nucleoside phosphorylase [Candidatus Pacebacteria bacterium]|nr:purine-nucleoside phosphorylase [Candidatus Paceibacterota bacterium]
MYSEKKAFQTLKNYLKQHQIDSFPQDVAILGTGWNQAVDPSTIEMELGYQELFGVQATVPGHDGRLIIAVIGKTKVAAMVGRFHRYEGYTSRQATLPIRVFAQAGAKRLLLTAASGALNEKYQVGDFVITSDLLTLFLPDSPLEGPQFLDLSEAFSWEMRKKLRAVALELDLPVREGIYAYYHGPNFETPADKMALKFLGGDVVGMSTVPETIMARWLKLEVASLSFVTNLAFVKHDHQEVLAAAKQSSQKMVELLTRFYS